MAAPSIEGTAPFTVGGSTYETWYTIIGSLKGGKRPLVALHGGPGCSHDYLLGLAVLNQTSEIPIILYDQLGNGNSTHLREKGADFWTPELFMAELENLLKHLNVDRNFDMLGHSWGGMLASQFAATRAPKGLNKLIISDSPASMELWVSVCAKLIKGMPQKIQDTLKKHEDDGTTDSPEYQEAVGQFYAKHLCRIDPMPELVARTFAILESDPTVYGTMNGPSEFFVTGTLKDWNIIPNLPNIKVPTLILNGRYDEAQDDCVRPYFTQIHGAKWHTFQESSHMPFWEEREEYMRVVGDFLRS